MKANVGGYLSPHRKMLLDLKDDLNVLKELESISPSKRRDELITLIQQSLGLYDTVQLEGKADQLALNIASLEIQLQQAREFVRMVQEIFSDGDGDVTLTRLWLTNATQLMKACAPGTDSSNLAGR